jgi:membrane associated rhomboid family serine protease
LSPGGEGVECQPISMHEPAAIWTIAILAVTALTSFQGFRHPAFLERYIFNPAAVLRDKEYDRLITSGFLHADWVHFGFNAFSLYSFGGLVEEIFGAGTLLLIYFGSILGGSLLSLYLHRHHDYRALGASGGVCGVIFASIFLVPGGRIMMFPLPVPIPAWLYAILFLVGSFIGLRRQIGNIGHDAHLGGAVIGLLITTALHPGIVRASPVLYAAVMTVSVALFGYLWLNPLFLPPASLWARWRQRRAGEKARRAGARALTKEEEIDCLLDKISRSGLHTLNAAEKKELNSFSARKRPPGQ